MSFNIVKNDKKRVIIVGGGFGGLKLANKLKKSGCFSRQEQLSSVSSPDLSGRIRRTWTQLYLLPFPEDFSEAKRLLLPHGRGTGHFSREKDDPDFHR